MKLSFKRSPTRKFLVVTKEVWTREYEIEAASPEDAIEAVDAGLGEDNFGFELDHRMKTDTWVVIDPDTGEVL